MLKRSIPVCVFLCAFWLCIGGCTYTVTGYGGNRVVTDGTAYEINSAKSGAFAHTAFWVPGEGPCDIYIADTADGAPVTALGGYTGTGVPCAFSVVPSSDPETDTGRYVTLPPDPLDLGTEITWQDEEVTVHLGRYVEKISLPVSTGYPGIRGEDGTISFYRPRLRFECDPENGVFTDIGGMLCYRQDSSPVKEAESAQEPIPSGPVFSELSLSDRMCGRYRYDISEEEYAVLEFFRLKSAESSFLPEALRDAVYVSTGLYTDGSLSGYGAAILTPANTEVSYINMDPETAGLYEVRCFSSDTGAEQYRDEKPSLYAVSAFEEDHLELACIEAGGNTLISAEDASGEPLLLVRDRGLPSFFPYDTGRLESVFRSDEDASGAKVMHYRPGYAWLPAFPVTAGPSVVKLNADLTAEVIVLPEDTDAPPEIYRGVCGYRYEEKILDFYLTRLGYGETAYTGSIEIVWENEAIRWRSLEGRGSFPFIPDNETEIAVSTR